MSFKSLTGARKGKHSAQPSPCLCHAGQARQAWIPKQPGKVWKAFSSSSCSVSAHTNLKPSLSEKSYEEGTEGGKPLQRFNTAHKSIPRHKWQLQIAALVNKGNCCQRDAKSVGTPQVVLTSSSFHGVLPEHSSFSLIMWVVTNRAESWNLQTTLGSDF